MTSVIGFAIAAVLLFVLLMVFAKKLQPRAKTDDLLKELCNAKLPSSRHCSSVIASQLLSGEDLRFLQSRVPSRARESAIRARRDFVLTYLGELRDDYRSLNRIARLVAGASRSASAKHELWRIGAAFSFECKWCIVWVKVRSGAHPVKQLQDMAAEIGAIASQLDAALTAWQETMLSRGPGTVRA